MDAIEMLENASRNLKNARATGSEAFIEMALEQIETAIKALENESLNRKAQQERHP